MNMKHRKSWLWARVVVLSSLLVTSHGGCEMPSSWAGHWFQHGSGRASISINSTHIDSKGECLMSDGEKFVFLESSSPEKCYRCIVMHKKHNNVLQYKETYCMQDITPMSELCGEINGDATLWSMFRMDAQSIPCPFKLPPFSVVYNKGHGDCSSPASRADPCTDETRLVFRFQACPDVHGTEAAVEELECLATWREGTNHYLVGRFHHKMASVDEDRYRCFLYHKVDHTYQLAQSGDSSCVGLASPYEGSRIMKLTKIESQQKRCKFPSWVTQHYHWRSLDYSHSFHFFHRNASLKITRRSGVTETKLMCHSVEMEKANMARIVVHVISGCSGGYECMTLHKRDAHVIQMQQSEAFSDPAEACASTSYEASSSEKTITMITGTLPTVKCPLEGKYSQTTIVTDPTSVLDCSKHTSLQQQLSMGCSDTQDIMEFEPSCTTKLATKTTYSCHGSWKENSTTYVVGSPLSRHSNDARHYCFIFNQTPGSGNGLTIQRVTETCASPYKYSDWIFNFTEIGKCTDNSSAPTVAILPAAILLVLMFALCQSLR